MKKLKSNKGLNIFLVIAVIFFLIREVKVDNYNVYGLVLIPVLCIGVMWRSLGHNLKKKFNKTILFSLVSFCVFGEKTLISFVIPFGCGLLVWSVLALYDYKRIKKDVGKSDYLEE